MVELVFNIETCRDNNTPAELKPQFEMPDKSIITAPKNYKKEDAIRDYIEREYLNQVEERKAKFAKDIAEMGLHPLTGKVCCISYGFANPDLVKFVEEENDVAEYFGKEIMTMSSDNERSLLMQFSSMLRAILNASRAHVRIVTYNGKGFDVPFLNVRMAYYDIPNVLGIDMYLRRYVREQHVDIYEILTSSLSSRKGKLRDFASFFGTRKVIGGGEDVQGWVDNGKWDQVGTHCHSNVAATKDIYHKIKGSFAI